MGKALARAGCAVSIWGRNPEKNRAALAELAPCGAPVEARTCDVVDRAAIEDAFAGTLQAFGRVDGCFANAGVGATGRQAFVDRAADGNGGACLRSTSTASFMSSRWRFGT